MNESESPPRKHDRDDEKARREMSEAISFRHQHSARLKEALENIQSLPMPLARRPHAR
jgi:hypothetical protein